MLFTQYTIVQPTAVDLFCGTGGMSYGLQRAGLNVAAGVDIDPECRYPFEQNTGGEFVEADVSDLTRRELEDLFGSAATRVLVGCAPCKPFSNNNTAQEGDERDDYDLLYELNRLVLRTDPEIVAVENVASVRRHEVYSRFVDTLRKRGYDLSINTVHSEEYGVPQTRKRLVVLASKLGTPELLPPTHPEAEDHQTARDAIGDLPPIEAGTVHPDDPLHRAAELGQTNVERLQVMPPGGNVYDIPDDLRPPSKRGMTPGGDGFAHSYSRMAYDEPAPTISTQFFRYGTGPYGHPDERQHRALSLREGARIQTFFDEYVFLPPDTEPDFTRVGRLIGNAVPPRLAEVVGQSIREHLEQHDVQTAV